MQNSKKTLLILLVILTSCPLCSMGAKVDYLYVYHIKGQVTDNLGNPVEGAAVYRVFEDLEDPAELPDMYKTQTDSRGYFEFNYTGLGGKPVEYQNWRILVKHQDYKAAAISINIPWIDYVSEKSDFGYVKKDLKIILTK